MRWPSASGSRRRACCAGSGITRKPTVPSPSRREAARRWSRSTRSGTSSKKVPKTLDLEGLRARDGPADRLGVRWPRPGHAGSLAQALGALGRAPVLHRRLRALRWGVRLFCTDDYAPYDEALPVGRHYIGKDQTQHSESNNSRQRHWFARFRRRTCVVSRSVEMVDATMALFAFYHCNGGSFIPALVG